MAKGVYYERNKDKTYSKERNIGRNISQIKITSHYKHPFTFYNATDMNVYRIIILRNWQIISPPLNCEQYCAQFSNIYTVANSSPSITSLFISFKEDNKSKRRGEISM